MPRAFIPRNHRRARNLQSKGIYWGEQKVSEENNSATFLHDIFVCLRLTLTCNTFIAFGAKDNNHLHKP